MIIQILNRVQDDVLFFRPFFLEKYRTLIFQAAGRHRSLSISTTRTAGMGGPE